MIPEVREARKSLETVLLISQRRLFLIKNNHVKLGFNQGKWDLFITFAT